MAYQFKYKERSCGEKTKPTMGWADKAQPPEARYSRLVKRIESFFDVINHKQRGTSAVQGPVYQPS